MLSTFPVRCFEVFFFAYKKYIGDLRLCQVLLEVMHIMINRDNYILLRKAMADISHHVHRMWKASWSLRKSSNFHS